MLHWLPILQRITFKIALLTFKALSCHEPSYLHQLLMPYQPTRHLKSADQCLLTVPNIKSSFGRRSFSFSSLQYVILCLCPCVLVILFLPSVNCLKLTCFLLEIFFLPAPTWILDLHHFYLLFGLQSLI